MPVDLMSQVSPNPAHPGLDMKCIWCDIIKCYRFELAKIAISQKLVLQPSVIFSMMSEKGKADGWAHWKWKWTSDCIYIYGCQPKNMGLNPQIIHLFIGFLLFSPSILGGFRLFLETPIYIIYKVVYAICMVFFNFH